MFLGQLASNFAPIKLVKTLVFGYPKLTTSLHKTLITFYECTHTQPETERDRDRGGDGEIGREMWEEVAR